METQKYRDESEKLIDSLKNEHSENIDNLEKEKFALQKEVSTLEERIENLSENHSKAVGDYKLLTEQFDVHKSDKDEEISRLKEQIHKIEEDALQDLTDLGEQKAKEKLDFEEQIRKLEKDILHAEEDIRGGLMRENEFKGQIEIEQLRSQIDQLNASLAWTKQEKEEGQRKITDLEQTLQMTEKQGRIKELDEEVGESGEKIRNYENQISEFKFKIKDLESQLTEINDQKDKYKTLLKQIEGENRDLQNEHSNLKKQLAVSEARISEADHRHEQRLSELRKINSERKDLELSFTDKTTELSSLNTVIKQYEHHQIGYIKEIAEEKEKSTKLEQQMTKLKAENKHTKEELQNAMGQLEKKTATNQAVINDLLDNYRSSEKDKLTAMREVEERGAEIEVLRHRLELGDKKRKDLEERITEIVKERDSLIDRLNYYERSAKKVLTFARKKALKYIIKFMQINISETHITTRAHSQEPLTRYQELDLDEDLFDSSDSGSPRRFNLKPSQSTHDIPSSKFTHLIPTKVSGSSNFDIQNSMEVTFKLLKDKIASLEEERRNLVIRLRKSKTESEEFHANFLDQKQKATDAQKIIQRLHEDKIALETRLISSRQILVAQEESLRAREQDKKSFKAKIASADMHSRDKEARLQSLQNEITSLKLEIQNLEDDKKKFKDFEISWERERRNLENAFKDTKMELENVRRDRLMLIRDKEQRPKEVQLIQSVNRVTLTHRLKDSEQQTTICQQKCSELERTIERRQQSLSKMQHDETQWKHKIDNMKRTAADYQQMEVKIESLKIELEAMTQKWKNSENDREQIRRELIECRSKLNSTSLKTNDLQMIISELNGEKKRCQDRIEILEKYERDNTSMERELRRELEQIKGEKLTMIAETEELKRQLHRVET
uniref:Uncharacterized protein n=1 Tax=Panagrolaimus superbus TaxID=310955 RepID=A0A914YQF7_9BILA